MSFRIHATFILILQLFFFTITAGCNNNNKFSVIITPPEATVETGQTLQFKATVTPANASVAWSVDEGDAWGIISDAGVYTAPAIVPTPAQATVRATCITDPETSSTARVAIAGGSPGGTTTTTVADSGDIGSSCGTCKPGLTCITEAPGGYCTRECSNHADCGNGALCYQVNTDDGPVAICLSVCNSNADCRSGYDCQGDPGATVCYPAESGATTTIPGGSGGSYTNADLQGCYPKQAAPITFQYRFDGVSRFIWNTYNPASGTASWGGSYQVSGGPDDGHLQLTYDDGTVEDYSLLISPDKSYFTINGNTYYYSQSGEECN